MEGTPESQDDALDRRAEWFVPRFGSLRFRSIMGLLFLPYTGMVLAFSVIGSMLAKQIHWDRVLAIGIIYFLGLGVAAHALDALGSKKVKPWGEVLTRSQLWLIAALSLGGAYVIAVYYMIFYTPLLWGVAIIEGFFVFAYNLEWLGGRFHTDAWFAFSWGFLPVMAGYILQTNRISLEVLIVGGGMALFSVIEIKASRPYKELKRRSATLDDEKKFLAKRYEAILQCVSLGVILLGAGLLIWRLS
jgi:hypothetical protein